MIRRRSAVAVAVLLIGGMAVALGTIGGSGADTIGHSGGAPSAPASVQATQAGPAPDLEVSWTPATGGPAATGALVQVYYLDGGSYAYLTAITCGGGCTSATFRGLAVGTTYEGTVWPRNSSGTGTPGGSSPVTLTSTCPGGACVTVDATTPIGPADHAASGILHAVYPVGNAEADMQALGTTMHRDAPVYNADGSFDWTSWNAGVAGGAQSTLILSDLWYGANGGSPPTPWSNWNAYSAWVTTTVSTIVASGEPVDYWEVYNEPGTDDGYYSAANFGTVTPALLLQQFLVTYDDIKAVDPGAAIIGPSLEHWEDYPDQYGTATSPDPEFDMSTFLDFAAANDLQLAAISWHEIDDTLGPNPEENSLLPAAIEDHVAEARRLIAAHPVLGDPKIFINEYGMSEVQDIPGWDVAYLSALTDAGVDSAVRACWSPLECANPTLDGLLGTDGVSTMPDYWVRYLYGLMEGSMVATTSSNDWVTALGSYDAATQTVRGLVGRGEGCTQDPYCAATFPGDTVKAATSVTITVKVPWSSGNVSVAVVDVPGQSLVAMAQPTPTTSTATIVPDATLGGTITISVPNFADGDAYGFAISPSSVAGTGSTVVTAGPTVVTSSATDGTDGGTALGSQPVDSKGQSSWLVAADGGIFNFGDAGYFGSTGNLHLNRPIVGMAATPDGQGYWMVAADGGIFNFGDAGYFGSTGNLHLNRPIVGMAATPDGQGYWLVAADGGIFNFGDAGYFGSTGNLHLNRPIVGMAATPDGQGYWMVAADGGIFNFGDAGYFGSTGNINLNKAIVGMASTSDGGGYWLVAADGGIFNFGDAGYFGSTGNLHLNRPIVGMAATPDGQGYWLVAADGGIFNFGDAGYFGSTGNLHLSQPIVGTAP